MFNTTNNKMNAKWLQYKSLQKTVNNQNKKNILNIT